MTVTAREQQLTKLFLNERPTNLPDTMNGGLEYAVRTRPAVETHEDFMRRLYGDSYEVKDEADRLYFHVHELARARGITLVTEHSSDPLTGETIDQPMWYIEPITGISRDGKLFIDYEQMHETIGRVDPIFGTTVLLYQHWMLLGFEYDLEVRVTGETRSNGLRRPMLEAVPQIPGNNQTVAVVPNPLLYIPRSEDIAELESVIGTSVKQRFTEI